MAEATSVTYNVVFNTYGFKGIVAKYGMITTGDTLTLTSYATIGTAWWVQGMTPSGLFVSVSVASNVITFQATSGVGSGYVYVVGL